MHQDITVKGKFECSSSDLKYFHVSSLQTPLGECKNSLLRTSDVISIDFGAQNKLFDSDIIMSSNQPCP